MSTSDKLTKEEVLKRFIRKEYGTEGLLTYDEGHLQIEDEQSFNAVLARLTEVETEYQAASSRVTQHQNAETVFALRKKQRMQESKKRREERKQKSEKLRQERAAAWEQRKLESIIYLGGEKNNWLYIPPHPSHVKRLESFGLPILQTPQDLAEALQVSLPELQFLCYHRSLSSTRTYQCFRIPKKTGGYREISAPIASLKQAQYWIQEHILALMPQLDCVHGFVAGRSIVTNATPHVQKEIVINLDVQDFFPSITHKRVLKLFRYLGYPHAVALCLARLCTEQKYVKVSLDGQIKYISRGTRVLPQGAPTSPTISNLVMRNADLYIQSLAAQNQLVYTRYADDITLSTMNPDCRIGSILGSIGQRLKREGFVVHPKKTRIMRKTVRQEVTGIVVNEKLSVDRTTLMNFRAFLHCLEHKGPDQAYWHGASRPIDKAMGFASFVTMIDPNKGTRLLETAKRIAKKYRTL